MVGLAIGSIVIVVTDLREATAYAEESSVSAIRNGGLP